jgi:peptidyl-prolyl cis-trans isomerase C
MGGLSMKKQIGFNSKLALFTGILAVSGAALPVAVAAVSPNTELAKVNNRSVTVRDLTMSLGNMNDNQRASYLKDIGTRRQVLVGLIDQEVLAMQAEKDRVDQEPDFKAAIARARRQMLVEQVLAKNLGSKLGDSAVKKYYEQNKTRFTTDQVAVQHILVDTEAQAMDLIKRAKEGATDFQELAEKFSKDPSAKRNRGDIGLITRDFPLVENFKDAAFKASKGDVVGPVRTDYGFHVIKVTDKKPGRTLGFEEVEVRAREMLKQELIADYVANLKKQVKISIDEKALNQL